MLKILLRIIVVIIAVTFVLEMPSAYAIFGIRAARTVMAARKAKQITSSPTPEEAYAQEKAKFEKPVGPKEKQKGAEGVIQ